MLKRKKRKKIDLRQNKVLQAVDLGRDTERINQGQDRNQRTKIRRAKRIKKTKKERRRMTFKIKIKFNSNRIYKRKIINNN